jgi:arylsulfatase A-like enzyme
MKKFDAILLTACLVGAAGAFAQVPRPNFIIILADDLGYGDLSCFGSTAIATPHLDRLAAQGTRFTDFHSNGAVCSPTRAALLTGCYPIRAGVPGVVEAADKDQPGMDTTLLTLPQLLKQAGYATGLFGKWHLGYQTATNPKNRGFDEFKGFLAGNVDYFSHVDQEGYADWYHGTDTVTESGYLTTLITRQAISFIKRHQDEPFFLYVAHGAPHSPYQGPDDEAFRVVKPGQSQAGVPGQTEAQKLATYKVMIEYMDSEIGRLIDSLKTLGLDKNTFVMFFSDNGPAGAIGSAGPFLGRKGSVLEGGHREPAIAWWPGTIAAGRTCAGTVAGFDLFPTVAAMAGITVRGLDGSDISPAILRGDTLPDRTLFWSSGNDIGVRRGKWKLDRINETVSLYNLEAALLESVDVSAAHPVIKDSLVSAMNAWQASVKIKPTVSWDFTTRVRPALAGDGGIVGQGSAWGGEVIVRFFSLNGKLLKTITRPGGDLRGEELTRLPAGICVAEYAGLEGNLLGTRRFMVHR